MAKKVPLPPGIKCPTDNELVIPNSQPLPDDVIEGTQELDWDGITYAGWQGEIPKMEAHVQAVGYDATCPPWLCDHAYEHCEGPERKPACDTCQPFLNYWADKEFPNGYIRSDSGRAQARGIYGHDSFTSLCGLWATPDFFADCCDYFDKGGDQIPKKVIEYSIAYASHILYRMSGRQFPGLCERVVFPGCDSATKLSPAYWDTYHQRDRDYAYQADGMWGQYGSLGPGDVGFLSGAGFGCCDTSCRTSGCEPDCLRLPGPINQIIEIVIDGEVLDPSRYAISGTRDLIRTDGLMWPRFNDMRRSPFELRSAVYATSTCIPKNQDKNWVKPYLNDVNLPEPRKLKALIKAPDWVNKILATHPQLIEALPHCEPWVYQWLKANGLEAYKIPCGGDTTIIYDMIEVETLRGFPANQCCANPDEFDNSANHCCKEPEVRIVLVPVTPSGETPEDPVCDFLTVDEGCAAHDSIEDCRYNAIVKSLERSEGGCSSWAIRYYQGKCPPIDAQLAAASLAARIAQRICVESCFPDNTARIVSEGIDVRMINRFQSIYPNFPFGILEVDAFLGSVNPNGLQRRGYAKRASTSTQKGQRIRSVRGF